MTDQTTLQSAVDTIRSANAKAPPNALANELATLETSNAKYSLELEETRGSLQGFRSLRAEIDKVIARYELKELEFVQALQCGLRSRADIEGRKAELGV